MKYSLDQIEGMLKDIDPFFMVPGTAVTQEQLLFVHKAPQIISDLVEEVKRLKAKIPPYKDSGLTWNGKPFYTDND